ncbi:MAG: ROK family protein [Proteobacteria bacterium]|nr:ROK family protein [Pseudomonadota bacterium]
MKDTYYLGFDIGGTNARCALIQNTDGQFKILTSQKHSIRGAQTPRDVAQVIRHVVAHIPANLNVTANMLSGIGVAIAGQIDIDEHTILNAPNLNWHNVDFYACIREAVSDLVPDIDIRIANDLNAIAWGEYNFGAARNIPSLLAVYVGTGIGAGLISDGKLLLGADNVSGEIGHCKFPHFHTDNPCGCGNTGCIEAFAGGKAIEYRILHDIQNHVVTRQELGLGEDEHPTARCIERTYKAGLPYAVEFWKETALALGMLVSNAIAILNPHGLLLGGGVLEGCPELLTLIIEHVMDMAPRAATANLQFIKPTLHDDAGTLGAALLCLK